MEEIKEFKVVMMSVDDIEPYENNPRKINEAAVDVVEESIDCYSWQQPLVVAKIDGKNELVVGHTRLLAAKKAGIKKVPVKIMEGFTKKQIDQYRIIDNKSGEKAVWDFQKLQLEMQSFDLDSDMVKLAFTPMELDTIMQANWEQNDVSAPEAPKAEEERHNLLLTKGQYMTVMLAINEKRTNSPEMTDGEALQAISQQFLDGLV